jgi:uncharacterized protein (DUF2141 family)
MTTRVNGPAEITIAFSEPMDRNSVEEALYIVPRLTREPEYRWRKTTLIIRCQEPWAPGRTYTVTAGAAASDLHGNRLPASYTFAFATGDRVDRGKISGTVGYYDGKKAPCLVWAYLLGTADAIDPTKREPDYVTQANTEGVFAFDYITAGQYRVFAVLDKNGDRAYTPGVDLAAAPPRDLAVTEAAPSADAGQFLLALRDTAGPHAVEAMAYDACHVTVGFDAAISPASLRSAAQWLVLDTSGTETLAVRLRYSADDKRQKVSLVTAPQRSGVTYRVVVRGIAGTDSLVTAGPETLEFAGSGIPDTGRPEIVSCQPSSDSTAGKVLVDEPLRLTFSKPMDTTGAATVRLVDSLGHTVECERTWPDPVHLVLRPRSVLTGAMRYACEVPLADCRDAGGLSGRDTTYRAVFRTVNMDTLGKLAGRVEDLEPDRPGAVIIRLVLQARPDINREVKLDRAGPFAFTYLLPGQYRLCAYKDVNGDSEYSHGRLVPYARPEPYTEYPEPVVIRSQWEVEEAVLQLK